MAASHDVWFDLLAFRLKSANLFIFLKLIIRDLPSRMKIFVKGSSDKDFCLQCESTDTIARVKAKVHDIKGIPIDLQWLKFNSQTLEENMTLADVGVQDQGSIILQHKSPGQYVTRSLFKLN